MAALAKVTRRVDWRRESLNRLGFTGDPFGLADTNLLRTATSGSPQ
jgi:hypothetical protein